MKSRSSYWTRIKKDLYLYPFLFAIFPILSLYTNNIQEVAFDSVLRSLIISLFGTVVLLSLCFVLLRDLNKAGSITSFILIQFFTYGHLYNFLKRDLGLGADIVRHRYLVVIYAGIFVVGLLIICKTRNKSSPITIWLNIISFALLVFPLIQIINYKAKVSKDLVISEYLLPNSNLRGGRVCLDS